MFETGGLAGRRCWCTTVVWDDEGYDEFGENDRGGLNRNFGGASGRAQICEGVVCCRKRRRLQIWQRCRASDKEQELIIPFVSLPSIGSHVVYFLQGHNKQVVVFTNKEVNSQMSNYLSIARSSFANFTMRLYTLMWRPMRFMLRRTCNR